MNASRNLPRPIRLLYLVRLLALLSVLAPVSRASDFALRDGDTVAFLGDSITAARGYTKVIEHYAHMRFPDRHIRFVNAGEGGDTAQRSLLRLERDVFAERATVLTVALGINDIGWGTRADDVHRQQYLDGIRDIVTQSQRRGIRVFVCSPAITAEDPDTAEKGYLQGMADEGMALARALGARSIDVSRVMRSIQRRVVSANASETDRSKHTRLHGDDGVHLNDLGQLAMAFAILKGLDAPAEVSSVALDATGLRVLASQGCVISGLERGGGGITFRRLDAGLPLNLGILSALNHRWIPFPDELNGYRLRVVGLDPGEHEVWVEGRLLGRYSAERLARGENIASATANGWEPGGPWDAQSDVVKELVDARDKAWGGAAFWRRYNASNPRAARLRREALAADNALVSLMRTTAKPYPYRFEIRRSGTAGASSAAERH